MYAGQPLLVTEGLSLGASSISNSISKHAFIEEIQAATFIVYSKTNDESEVE